MNYHYLGGNAHIYGFAPDQQLFGGYYPWANESGLFADHAPDNGMFQGTVFTFVGSTHLIEIAYHLPVINDVDTTNWITGGGYNAARGWNLHVVVNNATTRWGVFLFAIENWHSNNYVGQGSPLTKHHTFQVLIHIGEMTAYLF